MICNVYTAGPNATPGRSVAGTPLLRGPSRGLGATPARTPARDALGLNDPEVQVGFNPRIILSKRAFAFGMQN